MNVLITKVGGGVDWSTDGETNVVMVDFDALESAFPDQLDQLIAEVQHLPRTMPWRADVLAQLEARRVDVVENLMRSPHLAIDLHPEMITEPAT